MSRMEERAEERAKTHKDLEVWRESISLAKDIYRITQSFPKEEIYGLTSQIRRSVISVSSNIAEGSARSSRKEFLQFLYMSLGSLSELETQLILSKELGYLEDEDIFINVIKVRKLLLGLIKSLKRKINDER